MLIVIQALIFHIPIYICIVDDLTNMGSIYIYFFKMSIYIQVKWTKKYVDTYIRVLCLSNLHAAGKDVSIFKMKRKKKVTWGTRNQKHISHLGFVHFVDSSFQFKLRRDFIWELLIVKKKKKLDMTFYKNF